MSDKPSCNHDHSNDHGHSHSGGHSHSHSHGHSHGSMYTAEGRLKWAFWLNFVFAIIELIGGLWTQSMAVTSDALHDFGDALAIFLALVLEKKSTSKGDTHFSYGYRRLSTVSALITGVILVCGSIAVLVTTIPRLWEPVMPHTPGMIGLSFIGITANGIAMMMISKGSSMNEKMVKWHLLEDLMGWIFVLVGAIIMYFFGFPQIDSILAIGLSCWVAFNVIRQMKDILRVFMMGVPPGLNMQQVQARLTEIAGVNSVHHAHVWSLDGERHIFTGHLVIESNTTVEKLSQIKKEIRARLLEFQIVEATLETEVVGEDCSDPKHDS